MEVIFSNGTNTEKIGNPIEYHHNGDFAVALVRREENDQLFWRLRGVGYRSANFPVHAFDTIEEVEMHVRMNIGRFIDI